LQKILNQIKVAKYRSVDIPPSKITLAPVPASPGQVAQVQAAIIALPSRYRLQSLLFVCYCLFAIKSSFFGLDFKILSSFGFAQDRFCTKFCFCVPEPRPSKTGRGERPIADVKKTCKMQGHEDNGGNGT